MTLAVKIPIKKTQEVKRFLKINDLINRDFLPKKTKDHMYIAVLKKGLKKTSCFEYCDVVLKKKKVLGGVKDKLSGKLTKEEMKKAQRAFDMVGDIAIIDVPEGLGKKDKLIAQVIMSINKNVKTVLKKAGVHGDEFRTIPLKWVAGKKTKETETRENSCRLRLNVEKVYYSPRSSQERKRIYQMVKKGEDVLVMFSGCGPFTCSIAKNTDAASVVGVEKNPIGHRYEKENIKLNKLENAKAMKGDVRRLGAKLGKFDRILMPLPMTAEEFLDVALSAIKKGGMIHLYQFADWEERKRLYPMIKKACSDAGKKCRILRTVKCGQFSPKKYRVCVDIKVM